MSEKRWLSELHWRKEGKQSRSERTQSALMDAAEQLIFEKGTEATTIADIAKLAGSSVGSVYHHFKDKTALFHALFNRMTEDYAALNKQAANPALWAGAGVRDLLRGYLEVSLSTYREKSVAKAAVSAVMSDFPELATHYAEIQGETRRGLRKLILDRREEIGHPDPERAVAFAIDQLSAMLRARLDPSLAPARLEDRTDAAFVEAALEMMSGYLSLTP